MAERTYPPAGPIGSSMSRAYRQLSDAAWGLWTERRSRRVDDYPELVDTAREIVQWHAKAWAEEIRDEWKAAGVTLVVKPGDIRVAGSHRFTTAVARGLVRSALMEAPHRTNRRTVPHYTETVKL